MGHKWGAGKRPDVMYPQEAPSGVYGFGCVGGGGEGMAVWGRSTALPRTCYQATGADGLGQQTAHYVLWYYR